jgi:hypothetical protein
MTNNEIEELLQEVVAELHASQCMILALVQMLCDRRVLKEKGGEEKIFKELGLRVEDVQFENLCKVWMNERTRALQEKFARILEKQRIQ